MRGRVGTFVLGAVTVGLHVTKGSSVAALAGVLLSLLSDSC